MPKKKTYSDYLKQEMSDLIEKIDLEERQKQFMKGRWLDQLLWLESRATRCGNRHYTLRLITIIGGVIVPALVSVNTANVGEAKLKEIFGWSAFGLSQAVAVSAAVEELFSFGDNRRRYRNSAEAMKIQGWQFFQLSGPYEGAETHAEVYSTFASNVESIIEQDLEGFVHQTAQAAAKSEAKMQATVAQNVAIASMNLKEQLQQRPVSRVPQFRDGSPIQSRQPFAQAGRNQEGEDEFISPDQLRGNRREFASTSAFPNSSAFPPNSQTIGDDEDEFVSPDQLRGNPSGSRGNPLSFPPTNAMSNSTTVIPNSSQTIGDDEDEFVSPSQLPGNQFAVNDNPINTAPLSTVPKIVPPPPPQLATPEVVADILNCPLKDTQTYLPGVLAALQEHGILDKPTLIAAIATIGVETGGFCPINEYGDPQYFTSMYEGRQDLGNTESGDGVRYHGRGFIQATGRAVYREYSQKLGLGSALEDNPELALDPEISAKILACYFADRGVSVAAKNGDWQKVRKLVNGGLNGWDTFDNFVQRALKTL